jgi:hypothetical protein
MKLTDKILIFLSIFVIILSLIQLSKLTGFASSESMINLTVETSANINFTSNRINFGSGRVALGKDNATIDTLGNVIDGNWSSTYQGFEIENTGNTDIILTLRSDKNASEFLGGTNPSYEFNVSTIGINSCESESFNLSEWYSLTTSEVMICNNLSYEDNNDNIRIDIMLVIPSDAIIGSKSSNLIATGTAA